MTSGGPESGLNRRIRWIRVERLGMSMAELARALADGDGVNYDASSISRWERGERFPPSDYLVALAGLSQVNGHWLLMEEGSPDTLPGAAEKVLDLIRDLVSPRAGVVDERMYDRMSVIAEQIARDRAALERESA